MNHEDPFPAWFIRWWKIYGLSALLIKPYTLCRLKTDGFSEPHAHLTGILYKHVEDIVRIEDADFINALRRCGHTHWFVAHEFIARTLTPNRDGTQMEYNEFHLQSNPEQNPFISINFLQPLGNHESEIWESKKEVHVQCFTNYLLERFRHQHYTHT